MLSPFISNGRRINISLRSIKPSAYYKADAACKHDKTVHKNMKHLILHMKAKMLSASSLHL